MKSSFVIALLFICFISLSVEHNCPCASSSTVCALPSVCVASASATLQSKPSSSLSSSLELKFFPFNNLENCNIESFCASNPPGSYCYRPAKDISRGRCDCIQVAYIQCPFGAVNLCNRGFACAEGTDDFGVTTATCQRISTVTSVYTTNAVTRSLIATYSSSSTVVASISSSVGYSSSPYIFTFTSTSVYPFAAISTLKSVTRQLTQITTSLPYTIPPIAPVYITSSMCNGTLLGTPVISIVNATNSVPTVITDLCKGPFPRGISYVPKTYRVIAECPLTLTVSFPKSVIVESSSTNSQVSTAADQFSSVTSTFFSSSTSLTMPSSSISTFSSAITSASIQPSSSISIQPSSIIFSVSTQPSSTISSTSVQSPSTIMVTSTSTDLASSTTGLSGTVVATASSITTAVLTQSSTSSRIIGINTAPINTFSTSTL